MWRVRQKETLHGADVALIGLFSGNDKGFGARLDARAGRQRSWPSDGGSGRAETGAGSARTAGDGRGFVRGGSEAPGAGPSVPAAVVEHTPVAGSQ